jgi:hypothetical protein
VAKDTLYSEQIELDRLESGDQDPNTDQERRLAAIVTADIMIAEEYKRNVNDDTGLSLEDEWEDEYKLLKGGGLQWTTNIAYRSRSARKNRPNSEDNFIHNNIALQTSNITASPPDIRVSGKKLDDDTNDERADKITHISKFNDIRNNFKSTWKEVVREFVAYGPVFIKCVWDAEWTGGSGPDRWVGDIRLEQVYKEDMLFDPAIRNLRKDLDKSRFLGFRSRQFLDYLEERFPDFKGKLSEDVNEDPLVDEGNEPESTYLYEMYYVGFPEFMPPERVKELRERAARNEEEGDTYRAQDLYDMANGNVKGVHLAYIANDILLEYIPYAYDHGQYPGKFATRYYDPKSQFGYGEIRNIKIPQVLHNKADEIEIEAMAKEGLGGVYYSTGAVTDAQKRKILENNAKGGVWLEVGNVAQIKERTGVKVPQSIPQYKDYKKQIIDNVSSVTPIQQGIGDPNMPFRSVQELGARTDVRIKEAAEILKDFLEEVNKLRIELFGQFYTEERYYRYCGSNGETIEGTFKNDELFDTWVRETEQEPMIDPATGQPTIDEMTGLPINNLIDKTERFIPTLDVDVTIISTKPNDRNYYTSTAFQLFQIGWLTGEDLLYTLDEGKLPDTEDIIDHVHAQDAVKAMMAQIASLPPEMQQQAQGAMQQVVQAMSQQAAMQAPQKGS